MEFKHCDILLDSLDNGYIIIDDNFIVTYWNKWLCINTQISQEQIIGKSLKEFYPDLNYIVLQRKIKTALSLKTPSFYDPNSNTKFIPIDRNKVTTSSLTLMQQQVIISPYLIRDKKVIISIYDISELHEMKLLLQQKNDKVTELNEVLETDKEIINQNIMIMRTLTNGTILDVSMLFCDFFEYEKQNIIGKSASILKIDESSKCLYEELQNIIINKESWSGELEIKTSSDKSKWVEARISPIFDENNNLIEFNTIYYDITNKKLLEELYITDALTKLYNRAYFDETLSSITKNQRKADIDFALILTDIDHFKSINDNYGHQIGDEALKTVAQTLKKSLRENDVIARWGGEEFVIMLKNVTVKEAEMITEKLRSAVENEKINDSFTCTCSFGISMYIPFEKIDDTFKRADDALYEAKHNGRNKVVTKL